MKFGTNKLITVAIVAALYAALTMLLSPISYGPVQFRLSELLCILPYFMPYTAWGLFSGCAIANVISTAGILDIVFGSLATLCAALCTALAGRRGRKLKNQLIACAMPVVWNAVVIGAVMTYTLIGISPLDEPKIFAFFAAQVGFGEAAVMFAGALPLMRFLQKQSFFTELVNKYS